MVLHLLFSLALAGPVQPYPMPWLYSVSALDWDTPKERATAIANTLWRFEKEISDDERSLMAYVGKFDGDMSFVFLLFHHDRLAGCFVIDSADPTPALVSHWRSKVAAMRVRFGEPESANEMPARLAKAEAEDRSSEVYGMILERSWTPGATWVFDNGATISVSIDVLDSGANRGKPFLLRSYLKDQSVAPFTQVMR